MGNSGAKPALESRQQCLNEICAELLSREKELISLQEQYQDCLSVNPMFHSILCGEKREKVKMARDKVKAARWLLDLVLRSNQMWLVPNPQIWLNKK
jgi:hypothetical protein